MARVLKPHGTLAAVQRHRYAREPLCDACKVADRKATSARYKRPGKSRETFLAYQRAYARAKERLRKAHPKEFKRLLDEELGR